MLFALRTSTDRPVGVCVRLCVAPVGRRAVIDIMHTFVSLASAYTMPERHAIGDSVCGSAPAH